MRTAAELFLEHLSLIERIVSLVCRRKGMQAEDIEEFSSEVKLRLIQDDYAVIRRFEKRSSLATYIAIVVTRILLDYRIRHWGKWYASAAATRLGAAAVDLERMLYRDERALTEATAALAAKYPEMTAAELEDLAESLPPRFRRKRVELDESILDLPTPAVFPADQESVGAWVSENVRDFIDGLPKNDQLLLQLRFDAEMTVAQIARTMQLNAKVVYRRLDRLFHDMRKALETAGVRAADIEEIVGDDAARLDFRLQDRAYPSPELVAVSEVRKSS